MHPARTVERVATLVRLRSLTAVRLTTTEISRRTGVSRGTIREWEQRGFDAVIKRRTDCEAWCDRRDEVPPPFYAYLLGMYLGDGCLSAGRGRIHVLRITLDDVYPGIIEECRTAMEAVLPNRVWTVAHPGCTEVASCSLHWRCLFPQHGPGEKHHRPIVLEPWQEQIALRDWPELFIRGLIHSDG